MPVIHYFNLRSEYSGNFSLRISGRGEVDVQTGASGDFTSKGETKSASSSLNGDNGNPSTAGRSSLDSYGILENRDFDGGGNSLGDGVKGGRDGIQVGSRLDSNKSKEDRGSQGSGPSNAGHHHSGHHTHSHGSNTSPSRSAGGSKKYNSTDASGSGTDNTTKPTDASGSGNDDTPKSTDAQMRSTAMTLSGTSKEEPSPDATPILTSPESSPSTTDIHDIMVDISASSESSLPLGPTLTSTSANIRISSTGRKPPASLATSTPTVQAPIVSPSSVGISPRNSRGLVGGIIGGVIAFSALLTLLVFLFVRRRRRLRITSSLFSFDPEKFVCAKRSAEPVDEAGVSTSATRLVSPIVVKWNPPPEWGDDRCHDDHDEVFRPTQAPRDKVAKPFQDAAHARTPIIFDPFADTVSVVKDPFHDPAPESRQAFRDSGTSSLTMFYEEGTVQEASRLPIRRFGSSVLLYDRDTFAKLR